MKPANDGGQATILGTNYAISFATKYIQNVGSW